MLSPFIVGKAEDHRTSGLRECDSSEEDSDHQRRSPGHAAVPQ